MTHSHSPSPRDNGPGFYRNGVFLSVAKPLGHPYTTSAMQCDKRRVGACGTEVSPCESEVEKDPAMRREEGNEDRRPRWKWDYDA